MNNEELYARARDLFLHYKSLDELRQAGELFEQLGDYERAKEYAEKTAVMLGYETGCHVTFGQWEGRPLSWTVMEKRGRMRLLACDDAELKHCYFKTFDDTSWAASSLREWLNGEFLKNAFTKAESLAIMPTRQSNLPSEKWYTPGGRDTMDKIYIPDLADLAKYWPEDKDRQLGDWWWVRNPGSSLRSAVAVYKDGSVYDFGINVHYTDGGVRPMMWVMIKA